MQNLSLTDSKEIDFVITWVDGSDPAWLEEKALYTQKTGPENVEKQWHDGNADGRDIRYRSWDLLRFWFRGVENFAPWVHKIYFVTWGHVPKWLNINYPKLCIVNHKDFIPEKYLPTFNSNAINLNMHRIPGLSERFVYFDDDMFLIRPVAPEIFFKNGLPCGAAIHSPWRTEYGDWFMTNEVNIAVLNKYFSSRKCVLKHPFKWINPLYGAKALRTVLMLPYPSFYGVLEDHLPHAFLKGTYEKLWELEPELLDATCSRKIRGILDVSQWLCEWWQYAEGQFNPRSIKAGECFHLGEKRKGKTFNDALSYIENQKGCMICVNDQAVDFDLNEARSMTASAFEKILPEKSEFEIE